MEADYNLAFEVAGSNRWGKPISICAPSSQRLSDLEKSAADAPKSTMEFVV